MSNKQEVLDFINRFKNKSSDALGEIIRNHTDYQLAAIKAAIILLEQRGYYSPKEKTRLFDYFENEKQREKQNTVNEPISISTRLKKIALVIWAILMTIRSCV